MRQILARLVHDNITRLLDGGVTDDGTPYFVMDYVDGMPIDGYCDTNRLNLEQRLALFLDVCDAVQFAHQNLVVHRDIKPGNVLVDASGTVRLLDFGIAKLLDPNETATELTQLARRPLTPAYASPEMLLAEPVDVTTDVYSLGVLCYRLLTGHLPVEFRRGLSAAEIEACVRCAPSVPASQAVLRDATVRDGAATDTAVDNDELAGGNVPAAELAARRRSDPRRLSARLSGDLDVILDTALARDRHRRYGSVELLARDLRCYREGLPILARRPTVRYRFGKFVRRHRVGLAAATVASLLLVGITAVSVRHAVVTERQSREIAAERDRAEEIKDFLQGVFLAADPSVSRGEELTAREILDRGARRLTDEMHDRPDLKADLLDTVADVYQGLGFFAEALPLIQQVAALRLELAGEQSPARGDALHKLAFLEEQLGDYELALEHAADSVAIRRNSEQPVDLAATLIVQARTLHRLGRLEEAHPLYVEALALSRAALTAPDERLAHSLVSLGTLEIALGNIDEAEALQREALQMRLVIYPDPATELVESYYNLGTVLHRREKYEEAKVAYNAALDVVLKLSPQPEGHPDEAYMLNGLARVYESLDEYGEAEATFRKAADTLRRHLGDRHPNVGIVQFNLGNVLVRQERCAQAELPLSEAISILSESAPGVAALANAQSRLGSCRLADGRLDDAR